MITYIPNKKIDKAKWDRCVDNDPEAAVFFYSWFLDVVCDGWDALIADDYNAVFPLPFKSKLGIHYIIQPFFTRTIDICSKKTEWKNYSEFLEKIPGKFRLQDFCIETALPLAGIKEPPAEKKYQSILLDRSFESLKKDFSDNTKQNLKKAVKNNLTVTHAVDSKKIAEDFRNLKGKELSKFGGNEYTTLKKIIDHCLEHRMGYSRAVINSEGERLASAFFMHAHKRIVYLKGSTSENGKKTGAMHLLMSSMINEFSDTKLILDFGGSSIPSLARFFKGFGAKDHIYYSYKKNNLPIPFRWLK